MSDWPVGLSTGCFYQQSIFDCLETIRNGGFTMIEVCTAPTHLDFKDHNAVKKAAHLCNKLGMEAYSLHAPFADHIDLTSWDRNQRENSKEEILKAAEASAILEVRYFVIHPGPEHAYTPPPHERIPRMQHAAEMLNTIAHRCHELGVQCVLENKLPHLIFGNSSDTLWIMGAMDTVNIGTCLDTGHAYLSGELYNVMHKLSGHLQMIHANDNFGQNDDHLPPGKGRIHWEKLLCELSETGFHGGFILELAAQKDNQRLLAEAREARKFLRNVMRRLALSSPPTVGVANRPE